MTTPTGGQTSGPIASSIPTVAVDEAVRSANRLGLTWGMRPGTVAFPVTADPTQVPIDLDGDTLTVSAYSLLGILMPGTRVMTTQVPPAGVYITGFVGAAPTETVVGARATDSGTILTANNVETNIPQLSLVGAALSGNMPYAFQGSLAVNGGGSATSFIFRWRKGAPVTGTVVASFIYLPGGTGFDDTKAFDCSYVPTSSHRDNYYLSAQRQAALIDLAIYGTSGTLQSHARLTHLGSYVVGASLYTDSA